MKIYLLIISLFVASMAQAQISKLDRLFEQYKEHKNVTSIKIGKPMFTMLNKMKISDTELEALKPLLSKVNSLKMLIMEGSNEPIKLEISEAIKHLNYEELLAINTEGNKIKIMAEAVQGEVLSNLLLSINADNDLIFIILDGGLRYDDINNMVKK